MKINVKAVLSGYAIMLIVFFGYLYHLNQKFNEKYKEPETTIEKLLIDKYEMYERYPFTITYCRRADWLVKLHIFRENSFRERFDYTSPDVLEWDKRIAETKDRVDTDLERFKRDNIDPPTAEDCQYIW